MSNMRLYIKASEWSRAPNDGSALYFPLEVVDNEEDAKLVGYCCLGLHGRACGISDDDMTGEGMPKGVLSASKWGKLSVSDQLFGYRNAWVEQDENARWTRDSFLATRCACINDSDATTDQEKIDLLRPIFAKIGVTIYWLPNA